MEPPRSLPVAAKRVGFFGAPAGGAASRKRLGWRARLGGLVAGALWVAGAVAGEPAEVPGRVLAVCADPANLPFSNQRLEGFENRIAQLVADELHATLRYAWNMQRRGFLRRTLGAGACDLVLGAPAGLPGLSLTRPYYRSTYVFVSLRERKLAVRGFDDPALASLQIGLHALGAEGANTPPAMALGARGLGAQVRGYEMWGDASEEDTPARLIDAVAHGDVDLAVVWGPFAGYYAKRYGGHLAIVAAEPDAITPDLPVAFDMSMGVRRGDDALRAEVQAALDRRQPQVRAILEEFGVPLLPLQPPARTASLPLPLP
jgi:mxaJ protein